jgi:hypothetical protein
MIRAVIFKMAGKWQVVVSDGPKPITENETFTWKAALRWADEAIWHETFKQVACDPRTTWQDWDVLREAYLDREERTRGRLYHNLFHPPKPKSLTRYVVAGRFAV